jgi:transcriptional regulator with XRE-family HTH domain
MTVKAKRHRVDHSRRSATSDDVDIGVRIRMRRSDLKWSQQELGTALGVSFQQVQKYEAGTNRVSASRVLEICRALEVDPNSLLGWQRRSNDPIRHPSAEQRHRLARADEIIE